MTPFRTHRGDSSPRPSTTGDRGDDPRSGWQGSWDPGAERYRELGGLGPKILPLIYSIQQVVREHRGYYEA